MSGEFQRRGDLAENIIRGIIWTLVGQGWVLVITFLATPFIVHRLTVSIYGVYALTSVIIGYLALLKLGLDTASIKYMSQYVAKGEDDKVASAFWSCIFIYLIIGLIGIAIINISTPFLVKRIFKISQELQDIAVFTLRVGSLGFLFLLISGVVSGAIQAKSRFDVLNRIDIFLCTLQVLAIVALLKFGFSLREIVVSNLVIQALGIAVYWVNANKLMPFLSVPSWDAKILVKLFRFGGFVTISGIVGPVLGNTEKIFLASLRSVQSLTYYSIPYFIMDRLSLVRSSFSTVLFPTFSYFQNSDEEKAGEDIHYRSTLYLLFAYLFFVLFFCFFGRPFLAAWAGEDFAQHSSGILNILIIAGLINATAAPSAILLQGMDKPNIPAIFHLIEAVLYVPAAYLLIYWWGGIGAACAWFLRVLLDAALLHKASCDLLKTSLVSWYRKIFYRGALPFILCGAAFWWLRSLNLRFLSPLNIGGMLSVFILYAFLVWRWGFDGTARTRVIDFLRNINI